MVLSSRSKHDLELCQLLQPLTPAGCQAFLFVVMALSVIRCGKVRADTFIPLQTLSLCVVDILMVILAADTRRLAVAFVVTIVISCIQSMIYSS